MTTASEGRVDALFLSPHPDDVELFCGGTVAALVERGHEVAIVDLSAGELSSNGTVKERREESLRAAKILGVRAERRVLGLPDGALSADDPRQLQALVEIVRTLRPTLVFAPYWHDRHPDHEAAGLLARKACFFSGVVRFSGRGDAHRPRALAAYPCHIVHPVSFTVDVGAVMEKRRAAIAAYRSQFTVREEKREGVHHTFINRPGFLQAREARLREWGLSSGVEFAEGFVLEAPILLSDPLRTLGEQGPR